MANKHFVELGQDQVSVARDCVLLKLRSNCWCAAQEIIAPRQPRLENEGGAALPPTAYHPSRMLASTELGVYVKWALLLQEQLEHVQGRLFLQSEWRNHVRGCHRVVVPNDSTQLKSGSCDPAPLHDWPCR